MTTIEIELAVVTLFGIRRHLIVPNISWGLNIHECDLLIVTRSGYCIEVEIKTSLQDLKRDASKHHRHNSNLIKRLFFAFPENVYKSEYIPDRAGIITIRDLASGRYAKIERPAQINKQARPLTADEMVHLGRLAPMRIWGLKRIIGSGLKSVI